MKLSKTVISAVIRGVSFFQVLSMIAVNGKDTNPSAPGTYNYRRSLYTEKVPH